MNTPNPIPPPENKWKKPVIWIVGLIILVAVLYAVTTEAATKEPPIHNTYYQVVSGSGQPIERSPDRETCIRRAQEIGRAAGETRTSGGNVTSCRATDNFIWSYISGTTQPPVCGPVQNSPRDVACPAGTMGTWSQTGSMGPPPECAVTWSPMTPPEGACPPIPPPALPAPANLRASNQGALAVRTTWDTVPERGSYELQSCRGTTCTTFTRLACLTENAYNHTLPVNATARYRVRASRAVDCSNPGPFSSIVSGNTSALYAALSWTPPTHNTDGTPITNLAGYRIQYGRTCSTRTQTIQLANPGAILYTVPNLTSGDWCFAVRAYSTDGSESVESNQVTKRIP